MKKTNSSIFLSPNAISLICPQCRKEVGKKQKPQAHEDGLLGHCKPCRRRFIQGGYTELSRNIDTLRRRIEMACGDKELQVEMEQSAVARVLAGEGNCADISLETSAHRKLYYGRWGQCGSDSNAMRALNGQKPVMS